VYNGISDKGSGNRGLEQDIAELSVKCLPVPGGQIGPWRSVFTEKCLPISQVGQTGSGQPVRIIDHDGRISLVVEIRRRFSCSLMPSGCIELPL
jgi:hypothetical protein